MNAVHAALFDAMRALLLAEAGRIGRECLGKLVFRDDLVDEPADHRVLGRADEVEVFALDLVHHGVHLRERHDALDHRAMDHERRDDVGEALVDHEIARVGEHALMQACDVAHQVIEAVTGDAARGVQINAVKPLHDLGVVRDGEIGRFCLAKALHFDVIAVVRANGDGFVNDLRDGQHDLADLFLVFPFLLFERGETLRLRGDLRLDGLGLLQLGGIFFGLPHEHTDLFRQRVALRAQIRCLVDGGAVGLVQLEHLVYERELGVLKFLFDVLFYQFRIFTDQSNVDHVFDISSCV